MYTKITDIIKVDTTKSGLLKWRPAGQIRPVAPLKVARGLALIKEKYGPNDVIPQCQMTP